MEKSFVIKILYDYDMFACSYNKKIINNYIEAHSTHVCTYTHKERETCTERASK